jgi:hypothetical protein
MITKIFADRDQLEQWHDANCTEDDSIDCIDVRLKSGMYVIDPNIDKTPPAKKPINPAHAAQAKVAKAEAKEAGFVPLKGTTKQKVWAEQLRINRIAEMTDAAVIQYAGSSYFSASKFWIETRKHKVDAINGLIKKVIEKDKAAMALRAQYEALMPNVPAGTVVTITDEQNKLIKKYSEVRNDLLTDIEYFK